MTPEEFDRWRDFARRLAWHGWPDATEARKRKIADAVDWFIEMQEPVKEKIDGWDGSGPSNDRYYLCDEVTMFLETQGYYHEDPDKEHRFATQISCCVRAGIDVAVHPSAGVVGFTVGTLRRMYDGEIPGWISSWFEPSLTGAEADEDGVWL